MPLRRENARTGRGRRSPERRGFNLRRDLGAPGRRVQSAVRPAPSEAGQVLDAGAHARSFPVRAARTNNLESPRGPAGAPRVLLDGDVSLCRGRFGAWRFPGELLGLPRRRPPRRDFARAPRPGEERHDALGRRAPLRHELYGARARLRVRRDGVDRRVRVSQVINLLCMNSPGLVRAAPRFWHYHKKSRSASVGLPETSIYND